ncbi:acetylornithine deacetylase [Chryseolinea serpens]|jgi:acetylornithine deacetylase|uniref:Acetylornithine deacetylase n=1 Tax=Chryseolinea serpens TaxID=947013 RepID=A0A1M5UFY7_9BACT|nr:M20 family metallo-hydrolase [Chryseolinea serpens]SHH61867.1 acetylornithine deacetylase [Chryseolinea serpens]
MESLHTEATALLMKLIATPSFSKEEEEVAFIIEEFFEKHGVHTYRRANNVWARNKHFNPAKPTVLLNSHHDTVRPNSGYTRDPFKPEIIDGKLYGLGSNDAGGPLVSLMATFLHYYHRTDLKYNLVIAATAEEEISGTGGVESIWSSLTPIDFAIVGEPTLCNMATAEKGLMVLDCLAKGKPGHAAREEGINSIYVALPDIEWFRTFRYPKVSETLGQMKMTVTIINSGSQHNVVPAECRFTVDVRVTDAYTLEEALEIIKQHVTCEVTPRSLRMRSSGIALDHPLVQSAKKLGLELYGSPTTSDQALIPVPSVKMGPGDSARSHSADEFIFAHEIEQGITTYIKLLDNVIVS